VASIGEDGDFERFDSGNIGTKESTLLNKLHALNSGNSPGIQQTSLYNSGREDLALDNFLNIMDGNEEGYT